jgi:hypothetical protein
MPNPDTRLGGTLLALAEPPKPIAEMTREEVVAWGGRVFDAAKASVEGKPPE